MVESVVRQIENDLVEHVDFLRLDALRRLDATKKAELAQFFTPAPVARLMASMLEYRCTDVHLLDPGAGIGILFAACVADLCRREDRPRSLAVTAYEIDSRLVEYIQDTLALCHRECDRVGIKFSGEVVQADYVASAVEMLGGDLFSSRVLPTFTSAITNPPYKKIHMASYARKMLRRIGIETSNIYTGFLAATVKLLAPKGELVAITPRSFCNGLYHKGFRESLIRDMSLHRLHMFTSRQEAFRDEDVLQETVIFHAIKAVQKGKVLITSNSGPDDQMVLTREVEHERVVDPADPDLFIRIVPDDLGELVADRMSLFVASLDDLGISVSTGRVVDFRATEFLRWQPAEKTAPLIYPTNFARGRIKWPRIDTKKPQGLLIADGSRDLLVPNEPYVLVKRFSAKEERRRIVAAVYNGHLPGQVIGFENHINYFHRNGGGLPMGLADGLATYLNSTLVDEYFRQFNGHTQVNATDLRSLRYPTLAQLESLGCRISAETPDQAEIDRIIKEELFAMVDGVNPVDAKKKIGEALTALKQLGLPRAQQNERSALTLLSLLDLKAETPWYEAAAPLRGITQMMDFFREHYGKKYAPNTRETVRRQTVHQFLEAGLIVANPDNPYRPINSGLTVYQIEQGALELLRTFGTGEWDKNLTAYLASVQTLKERYAQERDMVRIPITIVHETPITFSLSPGGQNILVQKIIEEFAPRFTPGGNLLYVGDTDEKFAYFDTKGLAELGVEIEHHGKMPDIIIHHTAKNWLLLIEAVTSHGPVDPKRRDELKRLFSGSKAGLVFVTAFLTRKAMVNYLSDISWETEVWVAESPTHMIHFNGERFLDPY